MNQETQIVFSSIADKHLDPPFKEELETSLHNNIKSQNNQSLNPNERVLYVLSDHFNDLDAMKQEMIMNYWAVEAAINT